MTKRALLTGITGKDGAYLAEFLLETGYEDASKPDGTPRKLLDTSRLPALGWTPRTELVAGIRSTYEWYLNNRSMLRT